MILVALLQRKIYYLFKEYMNDYSQNYLRIQKLLKCYHNATLKQQYETATRIAHDLAEETIKLEFATYDQVRKTWLA